MTDDRPTRSEGDRPDRERPEGDGIDEPFVAFLRREGARYRAPPETPADAMWPAIEAEWRLAASTGSGEAEAGDGREAATPEFTELPVADPVLTAAAEYHRPPEAPREAMWARVEAAWRLRAAAPPGAREAGWEALPEPEASARERGHRPADPAERLRARPARLAWAAGIAAALVLGILIGRGPLPGPGAGSDRVAVETDAGRTPGPLDDRGAVDDPAALDDAGAVARAPDVETPPADRTVGPPADAGSERAGPPRGEGPVTGDRLAAGPDAPARENVGGRELAGAGAATQRLAAERHLARVETFLTSFRQTEGGAGDAPETGRWARELLAETRLLLDWSAEEDPRLRTLLQELELVLAQIVRLDGGTAERDWVVDAMERRSVLPRLRSTDLPRSVGASGT